MTSFIQPDIFTGGAAAWPFGDLAPQSYGLIVCDPPWRFENYSAAGDEKGPEPHYATMTDAEILALPVGDLAAADAMLWLWCTWPKLETGLAALGRWGFQYKTGGAWDKRRWGTGYIWRSQCEPVLIGTRGSPAIDGRTVTNLICEPRREHSRKPEAAYVRAERMLAGVRRVSLFERIARPGWDAWGHEVGVAPGRKRAKRSRARPPLLEGMGGVAG